MAALRGADRVSWPLGETSLRQQAGTVPVASLVPWVAVLIALEDGWSIVGDEAYKNA